MVAQTKTYVILVTLNAAYSDLVCVCVCMCMVHCAKEYSIAQWTTHAHQVIICCHDTDNVCTDMHSWTRLVILAKLWL